MDVHFESERDISIEQAAGLTGMSKNTRPSEFVEDCICVEHGSVIWRRDKVDPRKESIPRTPLISQYMYLFVDSFLDSRPHYVDLHSDAT